MNHSTTKSPFENLNRRDALKLGLKTASAGGVLAAMGGLQEAAAADATGYKALVCVYMVGGNDGFNTLVPTATAGYSSYSRARRGLALSQASLLPITGTASDGYSYGFHPSCPELQTLFNTGRLAVLGNVGTLVQPTSKAQAQSGSVPLPLQLFSHADQQTQWWTSTPDRAESFGWAGRVADLYAGQGYAPRVALNVNVGGANYWQDGRRSIPYVLGTNGAPTFDALTSGYRNGARAAASQALFDQARSHPNLLVAEYGNIARNATDKVSVVNNALNAVGPVATPFPAYTNDSALGAQLRQVAHCIKARNSLGDRRQMFYVRLGGFDTHNGHLATQAELLRILSRNLSSFWAALQETGAQNDVTVFTASDFGRSLGSNTDGSDHAWGSHHLVLGGAVRGGFYGTMPELAIGGANDYGNGLIIPTTSTDQYAATLTRWFGVADTELDGLFPNLRNFSTRNLGFV